MPQPTPPAKADDEPQGVLSAFSQRQPSGKEGTPTRLPGTPGCILPTHTIRHPRGGKRPHTLTIAVDLPPRL
jgi:hypothetical protein